MNKKTFEWFKAWIDNQDTWLDISEMYCMLDVLEDELVEETCKTCKHFSDIGKGNHYYLCTNDLVGNVNHYMKVELDFGCNEWKTKMKIKQRLVIQKALEDDRKLNT